jgi:hypothetical protein
MTSILKVDTIQDADGNNIINESGNTITIGASGDTISIPSGANFNSVGIDDNADATAITIDSSEQVGIGTTSVLSPFHVASATADADGSLGSQAPQMILQGGTGNQNNRFEFGMDSSGGTAIGFLQSRNTASGVQDISLNPKGGNTIVGKSSTSTTITGSQFGSNGDLINILNASGYNIINRQADDGVYIYFKQANSTEGNISVSGTTVSYNGFTGTHWTRLIDNSKPTILKGTVLETLDEMVDWYNLEFDDSDGNAQKIPHLLTGSQSAEDVITYNHNGTDYQATIVREADIKHMKSKVSDTTDAKNVYGVFSHWDFGDDDGINDIIIASVGSFVVRIKSGETISKGDLLQSNGDGTAKVQTDDNIKSSSFAKVLSTTKIETYEDGSFIVPCSLMC